MRRIVAPLALVAFTTAAIAGCGDGDGETNDDVVEIEIASPDPACETTVAQPVAAAIVDEDGAVVRAEWLGSGSQAVCIARITGSGDDLELAIRLAGGPATSDLVQRCVTIALDESVSASATVTPSPAQEGDRAMVFSGPIDPADCPAFEPTE